MKKTILLGGVVSLMLASQTSCNSNSKSRPNWTQTDTIPGKVVHDDQGNRWVWHQGSPMSGLMGYWLISSMVGNQYSRYYPSRSMYSADRDRDYSGVRPSYVSPTPDKKMEGVMSNKPTTSAPVNRAAVAAGKAYSPNVLKKVTPSSSSSRSGFGSRSRSSSSRSVSS